MQKKFSDRSNTNAICFGQCPPVPHPHGLPSDPYTTGRDWSLTDGVSCDSDGEREVFRFVQV